MCLYEYVCEREGKRGTSPDPQINMNTHTFTYQHCEGVDQGGSRGHSISRPQYLPVYMYIRSRKRVSGYFIHDFPPHTHTTHTTDRVKHGVPSMRHVFINRDRHKTGFCDDAIDYTAIKGQEVIMRTRGQIGFERQESLRAGQNFGSLRRRLGRGVRGRGQGRHGLAGGDLL